MYKIYMVTLHSYYVCMYVYICMDICMICMYILKQQYYSMYILIS